MKKPDSNGGKTASQRIDQQIAELDDWRGDMLERVRKTILSSDPSMTESWKWGTAVWESNGLVCSAGAFKEHVKIFFFKGASIDDPKGVFNSGTDAKVSRAIDLREGDKLDMAGLKAMVRKAIALNEKPATNKKKR